MKDVLQQNKGAKLEREELDQSHSHTWSLVCLTLILFTLVNTASRNTGLESRGQNKDCMHCISAVLSNSTPHPQKQGVAKLQVSWNSGNRRSYKGNREENTQDENEQWQWDKISAYTVTRPDCNRSQDFRFYKSIRCKACRMRKYWEEIYSKAHKVDVFEEAEVAGILLESHGEQGHRQE